MKARTRGMKQSSASSNRLAGKITTKAEDYRQRAEDKLAEAKKSFERAEKKVRSFIDTNPKKALLIAAGIGVAVGAIATSFFRSAKR